MMFRSDLAKWQAILLLFVFASVTPIGVMVGWAILNSGSSDEEAELIGAYCQTFCAGTFLYLSIIILKEQPDRTHNQVDDKGVVHKAGSIRRLLFWCVGASVMAIVAIWA